MRVGALPSKPRKGTQGYQGGAHARRVLSVPLRREKTLSLQARFHAAFAIFFTATGRNTPTAAPAGDRPATSESRKLRQALENANISRDRRVDAKATG